MEVPEIEMTQPSRIKDLNGRPVADGLFVLYWMQSSQRVEWNHALEFSIMKANELKKPLVVFFGLADNYPGANQRHYRFMIEGLLDVKMELHKRGIEFVIRKGSPDESAVALANRASLVITDRGYTRIQKQWRTNVAHRVSCGMFQVESDVVVPVEIVSQKEEYAAATIRRKILRNIDEYICPVKKQKLKYGSVLIDGMEFDDVDPILDSMNIDRSVAASEYFRGGARYAKKNIDDFIAKKLKRYALDHSDPSLACESDLSPYLHFGQISPLFVAIEMINYGEEINGPFLEQLIVRRELAINLVNYNHSYDTTDSLPVWARESLCLHENDRREYDYTLDELEHSKTDDPYWNAAQTQMVKTGKMHNYMRMYWGKKVIEWSRSPETAYASLIFLNDKYELDGRDPNGYAGIAWCFGKHDRAWSERPIFGKIRYMNAKGLERKFDMKKYLDTINGL
jgi:deoxyribodipyrimidine photo-lyase